MSGQAAVSDQAAVVIPSHGSGKILGATWRFARTFQGYIHKVPLIGEDFVQTAKVTLKFKYESFFKRDSA